MKGGGGVKLTPRPPTEKATLKKPTLIRVNTSIYKFCWEKISLKDFFKLDNFLVKLFIGVAFSKKAK